MTKDRVWLYEQAKKVLAGGDTEVVCNFKEGGGPFVELQFDEKGRAGTEPVSVGWTLRTVAKDMDEHNQGEIAAIVGKLVLDHFENKPTAITLRLPKEIDPVGAGIGVALALLRPGVMKTAHSKDYYRGPEKVAVQLSTGGDAGAYEARFQRGLSLGRHLNLQRWLGALSPAILNPKSAAQLVEALLHQYEGCYERVVLPVEKMGLMAAVAAASDYEHYPECYLVHPESGETATWRALVGKGVTMDEGGATIKPHPHMLWMHMDGMGAYAVIACLLWALAHPDELAETTLFAMGFVENRVGPEGYMVNGVYEACNGATIEIWNTDAEGRLVLFDLIAALGILFPGRKIRARTLATLTGHALVAVGSKTATFMTKGNDLARNVHVVARSKLLGEPVEAFTMTGEHAEALSSHTADWKNADNEAPFGTQKGGTFIGFAAGDNIDYEHHDLACAAHNAGSPESGQVKGLPQHRGVLLGLEMICVEGAI